MCAAAAEGAISPSRHPQSIGKEYKGKVDMVLRDIVPTLNVGGKAIITSYQLQRDSGHEKADVGGSLEIAMRVKGFVPLETA